jgi:hypothetical protein
MSWGDYLYIIVLILFSWMTFTIIRNNFLSKFDEKQRRKDLIEEYDESYTQEEK